MRSLSTPQHLTGRRPRLNPACTCQWPAPASSEANAEANAHACSTFVAATEAGIPSFAASCGADAEAGDAETEAVAEIMGASPLPLEPTQPQRLRPDLPPNDLRLKLSRAHC